MDILRFIQYISLPLFATMYSCSNDVDKCYIPVEIPEGSKITFSVGSVNDSRVTIMNNSNFVADGRTIGIYADKHYGNIFNSSLRTNVMDNDELVYGNGSWNYSPIQFWPDSQDTLLSFIAYSPYNSNSTITSDGVVVVPYNRGTTNNEQGDLLWGITQDINTPNTPVTLNLSHALSKVIFNIDAQFAGSDVDELEITKVYIKGLSNGADLSINSNTNTCYWNNYSEISDVLVSNERLLVTNTKTQIGEPLLLIPQKLLNATIVIDYTVKDLSASYSEPRSSEFSLLTGNISMWSDNKTYTYNIHLDLSLDEFLLNIQISDFEEDTEMDVNIPGNGKEYTVMYYQSTDDQKVELNNLDAFDAELISNIYENGQGIMVFEGELTKIRRDAFNSYGNLSGIVIPKTVSCLDVFALSCKSLSEISVESGNEYYDSRNGCNAIIETESNTLIAGCSTTIIPENIVAIGSNAFKQRGFSIIQLGHLMGIHYQKFKFQWRLLRSIGVPRGGASMQI